MVNLFPTGPDWPGAEYKDTGACGPLMARSSVAWVITEQVCQGA